VITKHCTKCNQDKPIDEFENHSRDGKQFYCKPCRIVVQREYRARRNRLGKNHNSSSYLGVYIAERALSKFFDHIERMPYGNKGYDFLCGRGYKIDVKSSTIRNCGCNTRWMFNTKKNKTADYFLCVAFDDRDNLDPKHVWLIPGHVVNNRGSVTITNSIKYIAKWSEYEKPLDKVITCCNKMKTET
jgi:hypothetical protein